jgi:CheY-like chemotaxis protein
MKKKILLVRNEETFLVNAIKNALLSNRFEVTDSSYALSELAIKKNDADLIVLYTDQDFEEHKDAMVYFKDLCIEENMIMLIIGDKDAFDLVHKFVPKEDIAFEVTRPLDMADLINKVATATDEEFELARRKSILIVDDDPAYLGLVREWLRGTYKVYMANSGLQAIKWLGKNKVDLILLDHEMPITSGPQVLEMLRNDEETKSIPVMFLTGKGDKESVMKVVSLRPEGYFLKNIQKAELLEKLNEYFVLHK